MATKETISLRSKVLYKGFAFKLKKADIKVLFKNQRPEEQEKIWLELKDLKKNDVSKVKASSK